MGNIQNNEELNELKKHLDLRIDQIEHLLTLQLIKDVVSSQEEFFRESLSEEFRESIEESGFFIERIEPFSNKLAVYIKRNEKYGIKEMRNLVQYQGECVFVFVLEKATKVQIHKFREEKISYLVEGKELFICS